MDRDEIRRTFEQFFNKFKKTEGDKSAYSAVWSTLMPSGSFEINLTKCPRGTIFKCFANGEKVNEITGWDAFFAASQKFQQDYPELYDEEEFFQSMQDAL
ncbi:hypothetical protein M7784_09520 [Desulfovibrio aminophilus]|nr:hypothetical protein [Desulfovibrio aminophilus]MCM0755485.1 hypothetical protein [Desulfovibrio aminophilus]